MNITPEILAELRAHVTRVCDNCQGSCRVGGRKAVEDIGRWPCPECHEDAPGKTSDPNVAVEDVISLIDEVERLMKQWDYLNGELIASEAEVAKLQLENLKLQPGRCDLCGCDCGGCVICDDG